MTLLLTQPSGLSEVQRAIRDRFQEGGSAVDALLVLGILAAIVLGVHLLSRRQHTQDILSQRADPQKLFRDLIYMLNLTPPQRRLLASVASDLRLKHPATILLSPVIFQQCVQEWQSGRYPEASDGHKQSESALIAETCSVLFPSS